MSYDAKFAGWNSLTIEDLLVAYRKAFTDLGNMQTSHKTRR